MKNGRNLGLRLDPTTSAQLDAFEAQTKIQGATLARAALEAALEAYAKQGSIAFPLHVVTAKAQSDLRTTTRTTAPHRPRRRHRPPHPPKSPPQRTRKRIQSHREQKESELEKTSLDKKCFLNVRSYLRKNIISGPWRLKP